MVEERKCFDFTAGCVEERCAHYIHALHIFCEFALILSVACRHDRSIELILLDYLWWGVDSGLLRTSTRRFIHARKLGVYCIVDLPRDRIQQPDETCFSDPAFEEIVRS